MVDVPNKIYEELQGTKNNVVKNITIALVSFIGVVIVVFCVYPVLLNHDVVNWIQSGNFLYFILGTFIPVIIVRLINGNFESIYKEELSGEMPVKIKECYCCGNRCPESSMKVLYICQTCANEQKVE